MHEGAKSTVNFFRLLTEIRRQISLPFFLGTENRFDSIGWLTFLQTGLHS